MHVRGFGFVDLDGSDSVFVPPPLCSGLFDRDLVTVGFDVDPDGRRTAARTRLKRRVRTEVFGTLLEVEGRLRLRPDPHVAGGLLDVDPSVTLPPGTALLGTLTDSGVVPSRVFPSSSDPEAVRVRVVSRHLVTEGFSPALEAEAKKVVTKAKRPRRTLGSRRDLRSLPTFTIDAPHSMDLDDAVSVLPADSDGGLRVYVHIADVAEHVTEGSALDLAARDSATSVYLPGWTRPMLPRSLSEEALSLVPGVERDALTVELRITSEGEVTAVDLVETRILSNDRLSYDLAAEVLAGSEPDDLSDEAIETLRWLRTAAARLGLQRARRGGVEARRLEPELAVTVEDGELASYRPAPSNPAHLLIERLMVAANEAVASWLLSRGLPALLRRHDRPGPEAAAEMEVFAENLGFFPGFGPVLSPLSLAALEVQVAAAPQKAGALWEVMVRHLGRAAYTPDVAGHFGLGSDAYLHFTSPLRRYADLTVHRLVKAYLAGERAAGSYPSRIELLSLASHLNDRAQGAKQAENQMRKALWLVHLEGNEDVLPGRVTGVLPKGLMVTLDGSLVTGMVSYRDLSGGPWDADDLRHRALSPSGESYELGQALSVRILRADVESGNLDLVDVSRERGPRRADLSPTSSRPRRRRA